MEIILGKNAGFCYGVKMAVEGAKKEAKNAKKQIYCLGEIVHNKQVVEDLKQKGIIFIDKIEEAKNEAIVRAHGVAKEVYEYAKENKVKLKDFTCPNVLRIHKIVNKHREDGCYIFLCGSKEHPENIGTLSYCGENVSVIENEEDIEEALRKFEKSKNKKILLIAQTTYSIAKFDKIEKTLKEKLPEKVKLIIKNTICRATELRQMETEEIAKKVDYMIIVGGANSSNTKKLYEISKKHCKNAICVETVEGLPLEELKKYEKIGIMAGASTPDNIIESITKNLKY